MGYIFTILGVYSIYCFWGTHFWISLLAIVLTLYQVSSLSEMFKEKKGIQAEDKWQTKINMFSSLLILGIFIATFFI